MPTKQAASMQPMPEMSEQIARARAGDQQAMEQIIVAYQSRVAARVIAIIGHDNDLEDVCQHVFVKMILGLRRLKPIETFEAWLFRIARNAAFDHLRHRRARRFLVPWRESYDSIVGTTEPALNLKGVALDTAVAQLPPEDRELMLLIRDQYWNYSLLRARTGQTLSAIKSRLFRVRRRLRQLMLGALEQ
jgi:RNA polymerase sigma factor (sigma-70 family)